MYYNGQVEFDMCGNPIEPFATNWRMMWFGSWVPVRPTENGVDVGCAADRSGRNCLWGHGMGSVNNNTPTLSCGEQHRRFYRITGYGGNHWCERTRNTFGVLQPKTDSITKFKIEPTTSTAQTSYRHSTTNFNSALKVTSSPGFIAIPDQDVIGYDINCASKDDIESGRTNVSSWKKQYEFINDPRLMDNTKPDFQWNEVSRMIQVAARECKEEHVGNCNGFNVHVDNNGVVRRCLKHSFARPTAFDYIRRPFVKGILYFRKDEKLPWESEYPTDDEKRTLERFEEDAPKKESILDKIMNIPKLFTSKKEEQKEGFNLNYVIPETASLFLSIFADDEVQVYMFNKANNQLIGPVATAVFTKRRPEKIRIPNFTNNHLLVFRVRNTGGPGYFIANWDWNGKRYFTNRETVYVPTTSYVNRGRLASTGQYMGCYRDIDGQIALPKRLDIVKSVEECAAKANKVSGNSKNVLYGLRADGRGSAYCYTGEKFYGCNNTNSANEGKQYHLCNQNLSMGGVSQKIGSDSNASMAVYKLKENSEITKSPVELYSGNDWHVRSALSKYDDIDLTNAKLIKVQMSQSWNNKDDNIGFTNEIHFGNNVSLTHGFGYREFVWEPTQRSLTFSKDKVCSKRTATNYNANNFYDVADSSAKTLREPSLYEIDNTVCSSAIIDNTNLLDPANKDYVSQVITSNMAFLLRVANTSNDFAYLNDLKYKVRIDQDANIACVRNQNSNKCKEYFIKEDANKDATTTTMKCTSTQYTPDSWCVNALQSMYGGGREHLRYAIQYSQLLMRLIKLIVADNDISILIKELDNQVDLSEYGSLTTFKDFLNPNKLDNFSANDRLDKLKARIGTLIGYIYDFSKPTTRIDENGKSITLPAKININKVTTLTNENWSGSIFQTVLALYNVSRNMYDMDLK